MGQLKKSWPNGQDQTLLSNTTQVFFGVNDQAIGPSGGTADYVSARLGEATIIVDSGGSSSSKSRSTSGDPRQGASTSYSHTTNKNWQQQARKLLKPEEVVALPPTTAITFTPGVRPIITTLLRYFEEPGLGIRPGKSGRIFAAVGTLAASVGVGIWFIFVAFSLNLLAHGVQPQRQAAPHSLSHIRNQRTDVPFGENHVP
jgi:type IV secretion system protein VirD4